MAKEIFGAGVFVEATNEVADGVDEIFAATSGGVEEDVACVLLKGAALVVGHALEHLEMHRIASIRSRGQLECVGDVEQVMRTHTEVHGGEILRAHSLGEHAFEVGIRLRLGGKRRLRPAADGRLDPFHLHVGALDEAQHHRRATGSDASAGPVVEAALHRGSVGQVRLQHDARVHALQPGPAQRAHEGLGREVHIAVFLHIEVNHLGHHAAVGPLKSLFGRQAIQRLQPIAQHADGVLAGERRNLRIDSRDFHGDDLDVRQAQGVVVTLQSMCRLLFAEQCFTENVHVHPQAGLAAAMQVRLEQRIFRWQNHARRFAPHLLFGQGKGDAREHSAKERQRRQRQAIEPREKLRHTARLEDVQKLVNTAPRRFRPEGLVGELRDRHLVVRPLQHTVQLSELPTLFRGLDRCGARLEFTRPLDGALGQALGFAGAIQIFISAFTSPNLAMANSRSSRVWAAEICVRMRALPWGTTGKEKPMT